MFFKHTTQPYGAVFTRPRQPAPGHRPVQRKPADPSEPFQRLSSGRETLPSDARHPMIWPSCLCHSLPPTQPRRPGLCLSAIHVARTIPAILLGRFTVGNPLHFAETPLPALREDRLLFSALQRNISTSPFFSETGLTQGLCWTSSRVSVTRSCNDLNYICLHEHISAFLRRNHRFRPISGGSP